MIQIADWWTKTSKISQGRKKASEKIVWIHNQITKLFRQYLRAKTIERFDELDIREEKIDEDFFLNIKNEVLTNRLLQGIVLHPSDYASIPILNPRTEKRLLELGYAPIAPDIYLRDVVNIIEYNIRAKTDYSKTHRPIPPPPPLPPWEFIEKTKDLHDLYYDKQNKVYHKVDPATNKVVESEKAIEIDFTLSVETEGHQEFIAEVTSSITIQSKDKNNIKIIEEKIMRKAKEYFESLFDLDKERARQREIREFGRELKQRKKLVDSLILKEGMEYELAKEGNMILNVMIEKTKPSENDYRESFKII